MWLHTISDQAWRDGPSSEGDNNEPQRCSTASESDNGSGLIVGGERTATNAPYVSSGPIRMAASGHKWWITNLDGKVTFPPGYDPDLDQDRVVSMDEDSSDHQAWQNGPSSVDDAEDS
jgi:hypothetical protein